MGKGYLRDFDYGQVVGVRKAGYFISQTIKFFSMSCNIAMRMYQQKGKYYKTGVHRKNCGNKPAIEIKKDS